MIEVQWRYKGELMRDFWPWKWLSISRHFSGTKVWSWEFHWKGSDVWYHNFKRHHGKVPWNRLAWKATKLTLRLGRYIIGVGKIDRNYYYGKINVLVIKKGGLPVWVNLGHSCGMYYHPEFN